VADSASVPVEALLCGTKNEAELMKNVVGILRKFPFFLKVVCKTEEVQFR
jgi:hypothetical protein